MILIDFNQLAISNFVIANRWKRPPGQETGVKGLSGQEARYMILSSILKAKKMFGSKYGEVVICCDDRDSWRKDFFPYYKAKRRQARKDDDMNWQVIYNHLDEIRPELSTYLPYKVVQVDKCEADDIIAILAQKYSRTEKILVYSSDKDFPQLQRFKNVEQYNPRTKQFVYVDNPAAYKMEHIILGDEGDGVPNIKSDDNTFLDPNKRQKSIFREKLKEWVVTPKEKWCDEKMLRGFERNQTLIDFDFIPSDITRNIIDGYDSAPTATKKELSEYFRIFRLVNMVKNLQDF